MPKLIQITIALHYFVLVFSFLRGGFADNVVSVKDTAFSEFITCLSLEGDFSLKDACMSIPFCLKYQWLNAKTDCVAAMWAV